jgi:CheY-like chemotaxis protein
MAIQNILVVDDEVLIHSYLNKKLTQSGFTVTTANDGQEALEKAFERPFDMIFLDSKMPYLNGVEVCKKLKSDERTRHIPIVMLSAMAKPEEIEKGLAAGADKYLCKPVGFPDILQIINHYNMTE